MNINYEKNNDYMKLQLNYLDEYTFNKIKEFNTALRYMFLEMELQQYNNNYSVLYNIKNKVTLKDYLRNSLTNIQAFSLIDRLNRLVNCNFSNVRVGFIDLSEEAIFIKENSDYLNVQFLYVPINCNCNFIDGENVNRLVLEILLSIRDNDMRKRAMDFYKLNPRNLIGLLNVLKDKSNSNMNQQQFNNQGNLAVNYSVNNTGSNNNNINNYNNNNYQVMPQQTVKKQGFFTKLKRIFTDKNMEYYQTMPQNQNNNYNNNYNNTSSENMKNSTNNSFQEKTINNNSTQLNTTENNMANFAPAPKETEDNYETMVLISEFKLLVSNNNKVSEYKLYLDNTVIGRTSSSDIRIDSNIISKEHAAIVKLNGNYFLTDKNSKNGTYVNGRRVNPEENVKLNNGDIITLGNIECKFVG